MTLALPRVDRNLKAKFYQAMIMIIISIIIFVIIMRIILWFRQMSLTIKSLNIKTVNVEIMNFGVTKRRSSCFVWDKQGSPANKCLLLLRCLRVLANKFYWKKILRLWKNRNICGVCLLNVRLTPLFVRTKKLCCSWNP